MAIMRTDANARTSGQNWGVLLEFLAATGFVTTIDARTFRVCCSFLMLEQTIEGGSSSPPDPGNVTHRKAV
jgi:hypothetical protein